MLGADGARPYIGARVRRREDRRLLTGRGTFVDYDDDAQPLATSSLDYVIPSACEVPSMEVVYLVTPSPLNKEIARWQRRT